MVMPKRPSFASMSLCVLMYLGHPILSPLVLHQQIFGIIITGTITVVLVAIKLW